MMQTSLDILRDSIQQLEDLFMVCVVGEFNAGKSRFINALLGGRCVCVCACVYVYVYVCMYVMYVCA
jgi:ribosome biogenesis GTPase A